MAGPEAAGGKTALRKFDVLSATPNGAISGSASSGPATGAATGAALAAAPAAAGGITSFLSSRYDLPTTSLIFSCLSADPNSASAALEGFDREGPAGEHGAQAGTLAAALAAQLVPGWRALTCAPFWRWQLQTLLESPCLGVPGICRYTAARAAWTAQQVQLCLEADNCKQVVVLRSGLGTLAHSLAQPGVKFYEVDSRAEVARKKAALDAVLPGWRHAAQRPRFVEVDLLAGSLELITRLTAAGFDPSRRCCIVAEGLLPYLTPPQGGALLADLAALASPGSRLLFDFLHADALEGKAAELPGFNSLAASVAAKGTPLRSGLRPAFSALVRHLQPHNFRLASLVPPLEVARLSLQPPRLGAAARAGKAAAAAVPPAGCLPYVPPFFSLVAAVKSDPRLLLRHAVDAEPAGDHVSSTAWAAGSALASPYCILSSLAQLLGLGRSSSDSASRDSSSSGSSGEAAAAARPATPPPAVVPAMPESPAALRSQPSWTIGAAAAELAAAAGQAGPGADSKQAPAAGSSALLTASSIGPLSLSWRPASTGSRSSSRSSSTSAAGSSGDCSGSRGSVSADGGHLLAGGAAVRAAPAAAEHAEHAEQAEQAEQGWSLWSFFS
ncbi:hypothetical protein ABPG75_007024 [Micractinium tetrahymenae]